MIGVVVAVAVLSGVFVPLLLRDTRRADQRRRRGEFLRANANARAITAAFTSMQVTIGAALAPALAQVARAVADLGRDLDRLAETMWKDEL